MAHIGHYISGAGHVGLIGYLFLGQIFTSDPLPFEVANVSLVSAEEFAVLNAQQIPGFDEINPVAPSQPSTPGPQVFEPAQIIEPTPETPPVEQVVPEATLAPEPEIAPEPVPIPEPVAPPQADIATLVPPVVSDIPPPQTPTSPDISLRPQLRPAERVAPELVAPSDPDVTIAEVEQEAVTPEQNDTASTTETVQEATAPEATSTEIVTEAEESEAEESQEDVAFAPTQSRRPRIRPNRSLSVAAPVEAETSTTQAVQNVSAPNEPADLARETNASDRRNAAVEAALADVLSGGQDTLSSEPLSVGELQGLMLAVSQCWNVDVGSQVADVTVILGLEMNRDGTVIGQPRLISAEGGDPNAQNTAFQAARRAVLRCELGGYDLPDEKYDQWRQIEITFNPETMRVR